jgi:hypothetical protein
VVWHHDRWRLCGRQEAGAKKQNSIDGDANLGKAAAVRVQRELCDDGRVQATGVCLGVLEFLPFLSSRDKLAVPAPRVCTHRTQPRGPCALGIECHLRGLRGVALPSRGRRRRPQQNCFGRAPKC